MSTKTEIVVYRASYRKVFSASFRRMSFSTATPVNNSQRIRETLLLVVDSHCFDGLAVRTGSLVRQGHNFAIVGERRRCRDNYLTALLAFGG